MKVFATPAFVEQFEDFCVQRPVLRENSASAIPAETPSTPKTPPLREAMRSRVIATAIYGLVVLSLCIPAIQTRFASVHWFRTGPMTPMVVVRALVRDKRFAPFEMQDAAPAALTDAELQQVKDEIFDLASSADESLTSAAHGDLTDLAEWLCAVLKKPMTTRPEPLFSRHLAARTGSSISSRRPAGNTACENQCVSGSTF